MTPLHQFRDAILTVADFGGRVYGGSLVENEFETPCAVYTFEGMEIADSLRGILQRRRFLNFDLDIYADTDFQAYDLSMQCIAAVDATGHGNSEGFSGPYLRFLGVPSEKPLVLQSLDSYIAELTFGFNFVGVK